MILDQVITVFEVRKEMVKIYHYDNIQARKGEIHLLFEDNHYDIIERNEQIEAEKNSLSSNKNYYSHISKKTVQGTCVECNR